MTRVRLCAQHPGLILRHHNFENFPEGTTPHTTAPLDYLILFLSILLNPFVSHAIDLAGAFISPLFALCGGWFLWWWSRRMKLRFRWAMLILFAISPILVQATELGRPDHQSLLVLLVLIALCAEWTLQTENSRSWSVVSGVTWAFAIWVSAYEPLILLVIVIVLDIVRVRALEDSAHGAAAATFLSPQRRTGSLLFLAIIAFAVLLERRIPLPLFVSNPIFKNWARTIGELQPVWPLNPIWFQWVGWLILGLPFLIWFEFRKKSFPSLLIVPLLITTFLLTVWHARWGYFFALFFVIALPALLDLIKLRFAAWAIFALSILPILHAWDDKIWPNQSEFARRIEQRHEAIELRALALNLMSSKQEPFLAPWWLSPPIAYWSGQPGVAGSSHESLPGITDSTRFFLCEDAATAREILTRHEVAWVIAYDSDRVEKNSAALLGIPLPDRPLSRLLDQRPAQAPPFLVFSGQNGTGKVFAVVNNR